MGSRSEGEDLPTVVIGDRSPPRMKIYFQASISCSTGNRLSVCTV
ncbi:MAG TPA: hypothetical protein V6C90_00025 [Coleofasciculaceae cyanobacterium]